MFEGQIASPIALDPAAIVAMRKSLSAAIEGMIGMLDYLDGDTDLESTHAEDDLEPHLARAHADGPGCRISEPDHEHDGSETEDEY